MLRRPASAPSTGAGMESESMSASITPPNTRVGAWWFTLYTIAWLLIWTSQLTPLQLLLPLQLDSLNDSSNWVIGVVTSGLVLGIGGFAGVIAGPVAGALSDRGSRSRAKRRPWALLGVWITAVCLALTGMSQGPWLVAISWLGVSVGVAVASAAFTAMIADQLPVSQRGAASSAVGSSQAVGIVLGVGAVVLLGLGVLAGYLMLAVAMAVLGTATALLLPDPSGSVQAPHPKNSQKPRFAFLHDRNFMWVLWGRLTVNIGNALGTSLFLFFLLYGIGQNHTAAEDNLLLIIVVYTIFVVIASVVAGIVSDRIGRRRSLTVISAVVQAASGVIIVASPSFGATMVAAALMGLGYGGFSTVGLAFATDLLPSERDHARDLGVVNTTAALGQILGPVIGAGLVALVGGFWLVFTAAAVLSLLGAVLTGFAREKRPQDQQGRTASYAETRPSSSSSS